MHEGTFCEVRITMTFVLRGCDGFTTAPADRRTYAGTICAASKDLQVYGNWKHAITNRPAGLGESNPTKTY